MIFKKIWNYIHLYWQVYFGKTITWGTITELYAPIDYPDRIDLGKIDDLEILRDDIIKSVDLPKTEGDE
jgi:hypothetical protein